jgi:hypothetical protein
MKKKERKKKKKAEQVEGLRHSWMDLASDGVCRYVP